MFPRDKDGKLKWGPLPKGQARSLLAVVQRHSSTPAATRSLAPMTDSSDDEDVTVSKDKVQEQVFMHVTALTLRSVVSGET